MTQDEIIRVAQEAGFVIWSDTSRKGMVDWACEYDTELERFAALVAAHEREACANVCEEFGTLGDSESRSHAEAFAAAIRARSQTRGDK